MCQGDTITITISENTLDESIRNFQWSYSTTENGTYLELTDATNSWVEATTEGWYKVDVVYGENMCFAEGKIAVSTIDAPLMSVNDVIVCPDEEATLGISGFYAPFNDATEPSAMQWIKAEPGLPIAPTHPILSEDEEMVINPVNNESAGFYRVTAYDDFGCFVSNYIEVAMHNVPAFSLDNASICEGEAYSLVLPEALDGAGGTALWERRNDDATYSPIQAADVSALEAGSHTLRLDRKSTRLNSSHVRISYAVFCLKKKKKKI